MNDWYLSAPLEGVHYRQSETPGESPFPISPIILTCDAKTSARGVVS